MSTQTNASENIVGQSIVNGGNSTEGVSGSQSPLASPVQAIDAEVAHKAILQSLVDSGADSIATTTTTTTSFSGGFMDTDDITEPFGGSDSALTKAMNQIHDTTAEQFGRYFYVHAALLSTMAAQPQKCYRAFMAMEYADRMAMVQAIILGKGYVVGSPITDSLDKQMMAVTEPNRKSIYNIIGPVTDTPLMRTQSRSDRVHSGIFGSKTKAAVVHFGLVIFHKNQNVAFSFHEERRVVKNFSNKYKAENAQIVAKVQEKAYHLVEGHEVNGCFMKVAPKKISDEQFKNQGKNAGKRMIVGINAAVLLGGVKFVPFGSYRVPDSALQAFEIQAFPDLAGYDALRSVSIYAAMLSQPGGKIAIDKMVERFVPFAASNKLEANYVVAFYNNCASYARKPTLLPVGTIDPNLIFTFWANNSQDLLSFMAKDKGAMHSLGSVISYLGCETLGIGDSFYSVVPEKQRSAATWIVHNALDVASCLRLKVVCHDSQITPDRKGKARPYEGKSYNDCLRVVPRIYNVDYSTVKNGLAKVEVTMAPKSTVGNSVIDLTFDAQCFVIVSESKLQKFAGSADHNKIDQLIHDGPRGLYKGPDLNDKEKFIYDNFIVVFPLRYFNNRLMRKIWQHYNIGISFGPVTLLFSMIVVGTRRLAPLEETSMPNLDALGVQLWTLAYQRLFIINSLYSGVLASPVTVGDCQHTLSDSSPFVAHLMGLDNEDNVLAAYKVTQTSGHSDFIMQMPTVSMNALTTVAGLDDDIADWNWQSGNIQ